LDFFYCDYTTNGPSLIVNDDEPIILIRGTWSFDILIKSELPMKLRLSLKPILIENISISPVDIIMKVGKKETSF